MKYGWFVALAHVVASTRVELIEKNCVPSRNQRMVSGVTLLSHSIMYVWNCPQQEQFTLPPMPVDSLHGPPGLVLSMMSSSPTPGHVRPWRIGEPSIQNAGQ